MSGHFVCATCGQSHDGLPTDWAFKLPDDVWAIPAPGREEAARFTDDLCQYGERHFIRGLLSVPLPDMGSDFGWGVWAEVDVAVFQRYLEFYDADGSSEPQYSGTLANSLPGYVSSLHAPVDIQFRNATQRPLFRLSERDQSTLAIEQRTGIDSARYHQILDALPAYDAASRLGEQEEREGAAPDRSTLCISCTHVVEDGDSVLVVSRSGGDWVLLCGHTDHSHDEDDETLRILHWRHLVDRDPSLEDVIPALEVDYSAERTAVGGEWRKFFDPDTDD
ncbi:DUF2199 domain-containing protein [Sinorhizobium sp. RAC02]|uniref:DUF2199 domain-containing protein n=1 Tax=Sinorhizobium sp. RAC02 TaxID=1842534 RepID=UPI00083DAD04|nr:DUF2199 domain-containing protein [Sinorhizobium sp. RAC02]AOF90069.1 hypothetical protein BSY16_1690 [Sinorhizobium sp. RAC02]